MEGHSRLLSINKNSKAFEFTNLTKSESVWCSVKSKALILLNFLKYLFENDILTVYSLLLKRYVLSV